MWHNSYVTQEHFQLLARKFFSPEASQTQFEKKENLTVWLLIKKQNSRYLRKSTTDQQLITKGKIQLTELPQNVNIAVIFLLHWPLRLFMSAHLNCLVPWSLLGFSPRLLWFSTTSLNSWVLMASKENSNISKCCNKPIVKTIMHMNSYMAFGWYQKERVTEKQETAKSPT